MEKKYFSYTGTGTEVAILFIKNILLSIITIGIYRPWARTNTRRYLWSHIQFEGDRGTYTGTGTELWKGWVKLIGVTILILIVLKAVAFLVGRMVPALEVGLLPLLSGFTYIYIFSIAVYSGLRYRMSRTQWRQINFGVVRDREKAKKFSQLYVTGTFLSGITLGIYLPWYKNNVHKFLVDHSRFGNKEFRYEGNGGEYAGIFWKNLILTILTLGIYTPWFIKNTLQYRLSKTYVDQAHFGIDLKGGQLLKYAVLSYLILLFTFGLASPWLFNWGYHLFVDNIFLQGEAALDTVQQVAYEGSATGEEAVMDYDLDFGF